MDEANLPPQMLYLEVTESLLASSVQHARQTLSLIRDRGVRLAVDDFGTGYSSLLSLRDYPVDILKVDRQFVDRITEDDNTASIVQGVLRLADSLRLTTIAEGIETESQYQHLLDNGCQYGQGWLFGHPVPFSQLVGPGSAR